MKYENETCEGCRYFWRGGDNDSCLLKGQGHATRKDVDWRCEDFEPSLQCRQVRALEWIGYIQAGGRMPPVES